MLGLANAPLSALLDGVARSDVARQTSLWMVANLVAAIGTSAGAALLSMGVSMRRGLKRDESIGSAFSYALYGLAGLVGGSARLGAVSMLGIGSAGIGFSTVHVGSIVVGSLIVGFVANLQSGYLVQVQRHERQLDETVSLLTETLEAIPDAVFVFKPDGQVLLQNTAAKRLVVAGAPLRDRLAPEESSEVVGLLWERVVSGGMDVEAPLDLPRLPGRSLLARTTLVAGDAAAGTFLTTVRDATDELARRETEERQTQIAVVAQMAGGLAHDYRNLLTSISTSVALLQSSDSAALREELLSIVQRATEQGVVLSRRVLDATASADEDQQPVDLGLLVKDSGPMLRTLIGQDIELMIATESRPLVARLKPIQVVQAITNLVVNAAQAMPGGGQIKIDVRRDRDGTVIEVEDRGQGMAPDVVARAFDPYFSTKGAGRGTGLGLAQVQRTVIEAGGRAEIVSTPGAGTTVSLWFPVDEGDSPTKKSERTMVLPDAGKQGRPDGELVWLIEDDEMVRDSLEMWLHHGNYSVITFARAEDALRWVHGHELPRVLITDLTLPGMSGTELISQLRGESGPIPAILMTGLDVNEASLGIDPPFEFVPKPLDLDHLAGVLSRLVGALPSGDAS